ncbi:flagellar biosynthesis regulator FlaF [Pseudemcibacter aquimaris]|uniref:flagellar biosynthesis regulator FlaF n=1 Tax=Pseudemcibacter aquimaris TaxID=2857064 RepID=UPI00201285DF|nr:flagellar biosynthesis regulator FlaF [Pseudemcibacter aquimaris]MCC3860798.1 flagellar biosynthesis regulator FlaF [Pseudemcibacter aquimaris]WDU59618.1 flagellar biosynthesis regulator FlaF [Pseudemcibacter aquimaris]
MKSNPYQQSIQKTESPQQTEYRLFVEVTRALMDAKDLEKTDPKLHDALHWNRRMWSTFATDCAIEGNKLPKMLRAQIISLSIWVGKHSSKIIREDEDIQALIDVNKTVMEGLAMQERNAAGQNQTTPQGNQTAPSAPEAGNNPAARAGSSASIKV